MTKIDLVESQQDLTDTAVLLGMLFDELGDSGQSQFDSTEMKTTIQSVFFESETNWAYLARSTDGQAVGVIALNQCCSTYAGGIFGEITEFYVLPDWRSRQIGKQLLQMAGQLAKVKFWKRLEVGAPPKDRWQRSSQFYQANGFEDVGPRLRLVFPQNPSDRSVE